MRTSILIWTQQLTDLLLQLPAIVSAFERKSPRALADFMRWIDRAEALLSGNRMVEAARIAGHKSRILAPAFDADKRTNLRKRQSAVAVAALHEIQSTLQDALEPSATKLAQAREIARLLLQAIAQSAAVKYDPKVGFDILIAQIWGLCTSHEQLKPHALQLRTLVSNDDIKLLLASEIDLADFGGDKGGDNAVLPTAAAARR
jgi:hypothetical protein